MMKQPTIRSVIMISTPPTPATSPQEALHMALALAVFNLDVLVVLHGLGVLHAIKTDQGADHGSLFSKLGALEMYDIPKVQILERHWQQYGHAAPPAWVELTPSFKALFAAPYHIHAY